ncbi:Golgin subfamily A member 2 [Mactra antiquata]
MTEPTRRVNSGRPGSNASGRHSATGSVKNGNERPTSHNLASREEEYKKLNAELEAKTANLVKEAEDVLKGQESVLNEPRLLEKINTDEFLKAFEDDYMLANETCPDSENSKPSTVRPSSETKSTNQQRPLSRNNQSRGPTSNKKPGSAKARVKSGKSRVDDVALVDDAFMTEFKDFSLKNVVDNMEGLDLDEDDIHDDVLPTAAQDMGSEAQIRFLKAKLRVMQEEMDRLGQEINKKDEENSTLSLRVKELEEERGRLTRTNAGQTQQIDKFKKLAEDSKSKTDSLETQLAGTRKELEQLKRSQKQQTSTQSATEVRLNRALEEIEKYKEQLSRSKTSSRETADQEKRRVDQLLADNKRLEKQKNELMAGFKKQLKLIDILKRQKMHVEAAKMLSFSEEEFVKALEWGS